MILTNADEAKGSIYYGLHFYPGLAQYQEEGKEPYRVFLNEDTLRSMDPTFAGRPVFVLHVDEVESNLDELRKEADGWVVESFFNEADGKHWAKFIVTSEKGKQAIKRGMKLSNCYVPKTFGTGGTWNGIPYNKQIKTGEYEHLAIVPNPRYEESVIMTPDEFKKYNEDKNIELKKLANHNNEGEDKKMKFNFFKRAKVDNSTDLDTLLVVLPTSNKEIAIAKLINDADEKEMKKEEPKVAEGHHLVDCNGKTMTVNEMVQKHKEMCDAMDEMKSKKEDSDEEMKDSDEKSEDPAEKNDEDQDMETAKKEVPMSEDDKKSEKKSLQLESEEEKEVKDAKKKNAIEKAERLRNAEKSSFRNEVATVFLSQDQVARGRSLYGS